MTITAISDTHGMVPLPRLLIGYESDLLIHCGDVTGGHVNRTNRNRISHSHLASWNSFVSQLRQVRDWFKDVVIVPGNHDQICEVYPQRCKQELQQIGVHFLINDGTVLGPDKTLIWGLPHTPPFCDWFFEGTSMSKYTNEIPLDTNILVSHGPPYGILDEVRGVHKGSIGLVEKCADLRELKAVFFGHIHEAYGKTLMHGTKCFNCSTIDEHYHFVTRPPVIAKISM